MFVTCVRPLRGCRLIVVNFTLRVSLFAAVCCVGLPGAGSGRESLRLKIQSGPQCFELPHRERVDLAFIYSEQQLKNSRGRETNTLERRVEWELVEVEKEEENSKKFNGAFTLLTFTTCCDI